MGFDSGRRGGVVVCEASGLPVRASEARGRLRSLKGDVGHREIGGTACRKRNIDLRPIGVRPSGAARLDRYHFYLEIGPKFTLRHRCAARRAAEMSDRYHFNLRNRPKIRLRRSRAADRAARRSGKEQFQRVFLICPKKSAARAPTDFLKRRFLRQHLLLYTICETTTTLRDGTCGLRAHSHALAPTLRWPWERIAGRHVGSDFAGSLVKMRSHVVKRSLVSIARAPRSGHRLRGSRRIRTLWVHSH